MEVYRLRVYGSLLMVLLAGIRPLSAGPVVDSLRQALVTTSGADDSIGILNQIAVEFNRSDFDSVKYYAQQALAIAEAHGDTGKAARSHLIFGVATYFQGNHQDALDHYLVGLQGFEAVNDSIGIIGASNHLGTLYKKYKNYEKALEHFRRGLQISESIELSDGIADCLNNIGMVYEQMEEYELAMQHYVRSLHIKEEIGDRIGITYNQNNIAAVLAEMGQFDEALEQLHMALESRRSIGSRQSIAINLNNIGEVYYKQGKPDSALHYFRESLKISENIAFLDLVKHTYEYLSRTYVLQRNFKEAFQAHQQYAAVKDSIYNEQHTRQLTELQTKYETQKKEKAIAILEEKNAAAELNLHRERNQKSYIAAGGLLLLLLGLLGHNRYRQQQKHQLALEEMRQQQVRLNAIIRGEEKERKRMAEELHDGLGQMLSAVKLNVSGMQSLFHGEAKQTLFKQTLEMIDGSCSELRTISHNMMPSVLIKLGLLPALKEFIAKNNTPELEIHLEAIGLEKRPDEWIEITLYRIIQEIIENIIRHAQASEAIIQVFADDTEISVMIEDNGVGFDQVNRDNPQRGLKNIQSRVEFLKGSLEIDSTPGQGTTITISIPAGRELSSGQKLVTLG